MFEQFYRRVSVLPHSRGLFLEARETWQTTEDTIERAVLFYITARQAFAGIASISRKPTWVYDVNTGQCAKKWLSALHHLPEIHARLQSVQIECGEFRKIIERYDTPETLFYCDPPYVLYTRRHGEYLHEMTNDDHQQLIDHLLAIQGTAIVSGYHHPIYDRLAKSGWRVIEKDVPLWASNPRVTNGKRDRRTEVIWIHPRVWQVVTEKSAPIFYSFERVFDADAVDHKG